MTTDEDRNQSSSLESRDKLNTILHGYQVSQMIQVVCKLGIPDMLTERAKTAAELAHATGSNGRSIFRLMRTLAGLELFAHTERSTFSLVPLGHFLRSDYPGSLFQSALRVSGEDWNRWAILDEVVMTGKSASELLEGKAHYERLSEDADARQNFNSMMANWDSAVREDVISSYDFSGIGTLVDIGGGYGQYIIPILEKYPSMRGVLFDLPETVEEAQSRLNEQQLTDRCTFVSGSYLDTVPAGDSYFIKSVLMDNTDENAVKILSICRQAADANSRIIVVERLITRTQDMFMDMNMMVGTGGNVRTEEENRALIEAAGLRLNRVIPTASQYSILEAVPV